MPGWKPGALPLGYARKSVELTRGVEPLTACLQNRCSAGLSYVSAELAAGVEPALFILTMDAPSHEGQASTGGAAGSRTPMRDRARIGPVLTDSPVSVESTGDDPATSGLQSQCSPD